MAALQISLLGGFEARLASGEALPLKGRKTRALLAYLALSPSGRHTRDELATLLWSDRGQSQSRSSLRQSLAELRRALGGANSSLLISERDGIALDKTAVDVDVLRFEHLIDDSSPSGLEQASALYLGELLDGIDIHDPAFEIWLRDERQRLHGRACDALSMLLDRQATADTGRAIATARRLLALDPLREATHRALMRLYANKGERALALKQYRACRDVLAAELGIDPEPMTKKIAEEIRRSAPNAKEATGHEPEHETQGAESLTLPDKPSIAVLPFVNMSGDPEQEYFSDGITEDIIIELSRFRSLFVIASHSSFAFRGKAVDLRDVSRQLGVRYVVEGSVRKSGNRLRITAQLVDAMFNNHIWAERYDREVDDIFAVQDDVVRCIVATLTGQLGESIVSSTARKPTNSMTAYELYLRALKNRHHQFTPEKNIEARNLCEKAIEHDPRFAQAYALLADTYLTASFLGWSGDDTSDLALEIARRAISLDKNDAFACSTLGWSYIERTQWEEAEEQFERALLLNPNDADNRAWTADAFAALGRSEEGLELISEAMRRNPMHPELYWLILATVSFFARDYEVAIRAIRKLKHPMNWSYAIATSAYIRLGYDKEAAKQFQGLLSTFKAADDKARLTLAAEFALVSARQYRNSSDRQNFLGALREAGLPV